MLTVGVFLLSRVFESVAHLRDGLLFKLGTWVRIPLGAQSRTASGTARKNEEIPERCEQRSARDHRKRLMVSHRALVFAARSGAAS